MITPEQVKCRHEWDRSSPGTVCLLCGVDLRVVMSERPNNYSRSWWATVDEFAMQSGFTQKVVRGQAEWPKLDPDLETLAQDDAERMYPDHAFKDAQQIPLQYYRKLLSEIDDKLKRAQSGRHIKSLLGLRRLVLGDMHSDHPCLHDWRDDIDKCGKCGKTQYEIVYRNQNTCNHDWTARYFEPHPNAVDICKCCGKLYEQWHSERSRRRNTRKSLNRTRHRWFRALWRKWIWGLELEHKDAWATHINMRCYRLLRIFLVTHYPWIDEGSVISCAGLWFRPLTLRFWRWDISIWLQHVRHRLNRPTPQYGAGLYFGPSWRGDPYVNVQYGWRPQLRNCRREFSIQLWGRNFFGYPILTKIMGRAAARVTIKPARRIIDLITGRDMRRQGFEKMKRKRQTKIERDYWEGRLG